MTEQLNGHGDTIHREAVKAAINIVKTGPKPAIVKILSDIVDVSPDDLRNKVAFGEERKE